MIMIRSISKLKKNTGIVILVGIADRLVTTHIDMAAIANGQNMKWFPVKRIATMVMIVKKQP